MRSTGGEVVVFLGKVLSAKTNICRLNSISSRFLVPGSTYAGTQAAGVLRVITILSEIFDFSPFHLLILRRRIITILLDEHALPNVQDGHLFPGIRARDAYG